MTCREVVELMTDYMEGALTAAERDRFETHIAGCDGCREYLAQMRTTASLVGKLAALPVPTDLEQQLLRAFKHWKR